jgi:hypothetical protein
MAASCIWMTSSRSPVEIDVEAPPILEAPIEMEVAPDETVAEPG